MKNRGSRRMRNRLSVLVAAAVLAVTGSAVPAQAAPADAVQSVASTQATVTTFGPPSAQAYSCWGTHSIWGGTFIDASAGTVCNGTAQFLRSVIYIRERSPFGYVSTCAGGYAYRDAYYATSVVAPARCLSSGGNYTYWIYSEHYAEINGQVFSFTGGHWN